MNEQALEQLIENSLAEFYRRRMAKVEELSLSSFLPRKNPYLLRALALENAAEIVERVLHHHLTASDETIFGDAFFEPIALMASGGAVAQAAGVDFVIETDTVYKVYAMKSGPNVQNASQRARQGDEFNLIRSRLYKTHKQFDPIVGHGYGKYNTEPTKTRSYRDLSGQAFWRDITGDDDFYLKLIRLMKDAPRHHRDKFQGYWDAAVNRLTAEFVSRFCYEDGRISWERLTEYVSGEQQR